MYLMEDFNLYYYDMYYLMYYIINYIIIFVNNDYLYYILKYFL